MGIARYLIARSAPIIGPSSAAPFAGDGLPATVIRTARSRPSRAVRVGGTADPFGLGEVGLHSVVGWPISYMGRCLGALVTAQTVPLSEERRVFIAASLDSWRSA